MRFGHDHTIADQAIPHGGMSSVVNLIICHHHDGDNDAIKVGGDDVEQYELLSIGQVTSPICTSTANSIWFDLLCYFPSAVTAFLARLLLSDRCSGSHWANERHSLGSRATRATTALLLPANAAGLSAAMRCDRTNCRDPTNGHSLSR